jgi:hypothetical protein
MVKGDLLSSIPPRPLLEESHSRTKVLVKSNTPNIGVMDMESFKPKKVCLVVSLQTKAFVFSSTDKGEIVFP